jgi:hypothetical protein
MVVLVIECLQIAQMAISRQTQLFEEITISGLFESGTSIITE